MLDHLHKKRILGQFFTSKQSWLTPVIRNFIESTTCKKVVDPFAGKGDLLKCFPDKEQIGYDIDVSLGQWIYNDSLISIPADDTALCVTNPPYLAKNIARYLKLESPFRYFADSTLDNLYLIALKQCLDAYGYVIAIIPETFLLQKHFKERLRLVNVLKENPFDDTDFAVVVACWQPERTTAVKIYKDDQYIATWDEIQDKIPREPVPNLSVKFNVRNGLLGLIGIDSTNDQNIRFCNGDEIKPEAIKVSSRHKTRIKVDSSRSAVDYQPLINECNSILYQLRDETYDLILAPTKGNKKDGTQRRRLDFKIAKAIIHCAIHRMEKL